MIKEKANVIVRSRRMPLTILLEIFFISFWILTKRLLTINSPQLLNYTIEMKKILVLGVLLIAIALFGFLAFRENHNSTSEGIEAWQNPQTLPSTKGPSGPPPGF